VHCVPHTRLSILHDSLSFRVRHTQSSTLHDSLFRVCIIPNHPLSMILSSVCASYPIIHSPRFLLVPCASYPITHSPRFSTVPCVHHIRSSTLHHTIPITVSVQQILYRVSLLSFSNLPLLFSSSGRTITQPPTNKSITSTIK